MARWDGLVALSAMVGFLNGPWSDAQSRATRPVFDVASIRPCTESTPRPGGPKSGGVRSSPGSLHLGCTKVETLIQFAYLGYANGKPWPKINGMPLPPVSNRVLFQSIKGSPSWANSELYTIDAKADTPQSNEMMRGPMMQALLEDRFKLKIHREIRDVQAYVLAVAKGGPKLQQARRDACNPVNFDDRASLPAPDHPRRPGCGFFGPGRNGEGIDTYSQTMAGLCAQFSSWLDRDVIDKTSLTGTFDIHLDLPAQSFFPDRNPDLAQAAQPADPFGDVSAAVHKLGLKLESAKVPGEFLVIDHIERPAEN